MSNINDVNINDNNVNECASVFILPPLLVSKYLVRGLEGLCESGNGLISLFLLVHFDYFWSQVSVGVSINFEMKI